MDRYNGKFDGDEINESEINHPNADALRSNREVTTVSGFVWTVLWQIDLFTNR